MNNSLARLGDFMAWLGGADPEILAKVPRARARFTQMAGVLLTTAGIAALSMIFALHDGVQVPLALALLLGPVWGFIILNLDRFLVLTMDATHRWWVLLLMALPRLALAAVLALIISTPLVLRVFASDINSQLRTNQLVNSQKLATLEKNSKEVQDYNQAQAKIQQDQAVLAGRIPPNAYSPLQTDQQNIARLTPIVQADRQKELNAYEKWQCELAGQTGAGCPATSGLAGNGPRATTDQQAYQSALATYNQENGQLQQWLAKQKTDQAAANNLQQSALVTAQRQARTDLATQQALVAQLTPVIQRTEAQDTQANEANTGILAQLQALSDASAGDPSLNAARLAVLAVFFLIEILPVTVKVLLNLAGPTTYDLVARTRDDAIANQARKELAESRRIAEAESDARLNVAKDMIMRREGLGRQANAHVAGKLEAMIAKLLDRWSRQVEASLEASLEASGGETPNGSAPTGNGAVSGQKSPQTFRLPEDTDL